MGIHLERALILFEQSRFNLAEQEVRCDLQEEPDGGTANALLGLCLAERHAFQEAMAAAQEAIAREPNLAFAHYALASILQDSERLAEAEEAITEAIRLDPKHTNYFALQSSIRYEQGRWHEALEAARQGLLLDPEHVASSNLLAMALAKLGRATEARAAIEAALLRDPLNAVTHANQGWAFLQKGDTAFALNHFREALRLDAEFAMARQGVVECLKTRYLVYRLLLQFMLWLGGLSKRAQWALILGGTVGYLTLLVVEERNPTLQPWIRPVLCVYLSLGVLIWIADPLFNLLLRLDRFGSLALSAEQRAASTWVGVCLLAAALLAIIALALFSWEVLLGAGVCGLLMLPVARTFDCRPGWPQRLMVAYTLVLAVLGVVGVTISLATSPSASELGHNLLVAFAVGAFFSGLVALLLIASRPRH
jgi:tetratricopeptide (TPR) repeat protein